MNLTIYRPYKRLLLTALGVMFYGISLGLAMSVFNNFLHDTFHLQADRRGQLELPREMPGFLIVGISGALFFLTDKRKAILASVITAIGQFFMVYLGQAYSLMVLFMTIASVGDHLYFPMKSALVLACCQNRNRGRILGLTGSFEIAGIIGGGMIARFLTGIDAGYLAMYSTASCATLLAGLVFTVLPKSGDLNRERPQMVFRRRYTLYYILEFLFGARKQIFLTFGPWVLIQVFNRGVGTFAALTVVGHVMAIVANPIVGWAIDRYGERLVLTIDGMLLIVVCLGYAAANHLPIAAWCLPAALLCFLLDELLFFIGVARTSYLARIVERKDELSACLTAGVSINHVASMIFPLLAGMLWMSMGHEILFIGASGVAFLIVVTASRIPMTDVKQ